MKFLKVLVYILLIRPEVRGIDVPQRAWISQKMGIVVEPESLIIHYDRVKYSTIGVRFSLIPPMEKLNSPEEGCAIGPLRNQSLIALNKTVKDFFRTLPSHFNKFEDHYCEDGTLDCYLPTSLGTDGKQQRNKRQIVALVATVAGIAAVGAGIYHYLSGDGMDSHLQELDQHISKTDEWITNSAMSQDQYNRLSEGIFTKMYQGVLNNERLLAKAICQQSVEDIYHHAYLEYTILLEQYKDGFSRAMDGFVSEFLVSYDFLSKVLLQAEDLSKSAYRIDPGLFYLTSTCMMTRVDPENQIVYFTVLTPIILEQDVSPLYKVYNYGWWDGDINVKLKLPRYFYYLTEGDVARVATPSLSKCKYQRGLHLCHLRDSLLDHKSICINSVLHDGGLGECRMSSIKTERSCRYETTRGGIAMMGCDQYNIVKSFRGIPTHQLKRTNSSHLTFLSYRDFSQIVINHETVSTKGTYLVHHQEEKSIIPNTDLHDIAHLMIPGVEHDLQELHSYRERMRETTEGFVRDMMAKNVHKVGWLGVIVTVGASLILLSIIYYYGKKHYSGKKKREGMAEVADLVRRRTEIFID